jgi:outer membrane protein OmpA-like peptidoglycan-associated protein/tetratricopeptide (TPR) repeat protein
MRFLFIPRENFRFITGGKDRKKIYTTFEKISPMKIRFCRYFLAVPVFAVLSGTGIPGFSQDSASCKRIYDKKTEKLYDEGIGYFKKGNYTEAGRIMKGLIQQEEDFVDAWYVYGLINFKKRYANFREAERAFLKVVDICPTYDPYAWYYLGEICYGSEKYDSTIRYLEEFLKDVEKIRSDEDYYRAVQLVDYSRFYLDIVKSPVPFQPYVVKHISTPENEYLPILSPDNQLALFTREKKIPPDRNSVIPSIAYREKFMFSTLEPDGTFTEGTEMPEPFNINDNEGGASLTIDNNTLYYTVCRYSKTNSYYNCDIFFSEFINGEWTPVKSVSDKVNLPYSWESQPSISADGKTLYFVSDRNGGYGGYDIYRTIRTDDGDWGTPINLGPAINTSRNEKSPFIHPDGKTLYFSSDGWLGLGGYDVFYSRLGESGNWSKAVNIGFPINSPDDEVGFFVSTDGTHGFFASNKYDGVGGWDLYTFELYNKARPEKVLFLKGTVRSEVFQEPVKARIELKNLETKKISEIPLDTTTGNYVTVAPFNNDYIMTVKKEGYVYETRYLSRKDSIYRMPARLDVEIKPIELHKSYRINDIFFAFNSYELSAESKAVLDQLIQFLSENITISIEIQGHTDNIGNDEDNMKLSGNRARSVYEYLIASGVSAGRLTYKGYGETMPVADNSTEEGRARNRRTVFVITRK